MFRVLLPIVAVALLCPLSISAGPREEAEAALALAKAKQPKRAPEVIAKHHCFESLADAKAEANRLGKYLVVAVGMECNDLPDLRKALDDCVWCHQASYNGSSAPRLLVPTDAGCWSFPKSAIDRKQYSPADVRAVLGRRVSMAPAEGVGVKCQLCPVGQCPPGNCPHCPNCVPLKATSYARDCST